jgi:hypothetical protein
VGRCWKRSRCRPAVSPYGSKCGPTGHNSPRLPPLAASLHSVFSSRKGESKSVEPLWLCSAKNSHHNQNESTCAKETIYRGEMPPYTKRDAAFGPAGRVRRLPVIVHCQRGNTTALQASATTPPHCCGPYETTASCGCPQNAGVASSGSGWCSPSNALGRFMLLWARNRNQEDGRTSSRLGCCEKHAPNVGHYGLSETAISIPANKIIAVNGAAGPLCSIRKIR